MGDSARTRVGDERTREKAVARRRLRMVVGVNDVKGVKGLSGFVA
jgi:hypothetical protein